MSVAVTRYEDYAGNIPGPTQEYPNLNDPLFLQLLNGVDAIYDAPAHELDQITNAKDTLNGAVTTALYFADLNKPMTEFFKTKVLEDKENHRMCGKAGKPQFVQLAGPLLFKTSNGVREGRYGNLRHERLNYHKC
jgi:hypothetical protein